MTAGFSAGVAVVTLVYVSPERVIVVVTSECVGGE